MNPNLNYPRDTDLEGQFDPSMPWFGRVRPLFEAIPAGSRVLDVGCNTGGFGRRLLAEKPKCRIVGVDLAAHLLPLADAKGYRWTELCSAEHLFLFKDDHFDAVVLSEILEHADDPAACVREATRVLKPGGLLLGDVPSAMGKWGWRSLRGHKWHRRVFTRRTLRALLSRYTDVEDLRCAYADISAGYILPQWMTFRCRKPR